LHKLIVTSFIAGMVMVKREGKQIILQFNASVRGQYFEPGYVHFKGLPGGNNQIVDIYFLCMGTEMKNLAPLI
jgi:hypothetical protein